MKKIILCPFYYQKSLLSFLRKEQPFLDVKFIAKEEIINAYFGTFKNKSIFYIIKQYNLTYIVAKNYLSYLPFLNENQCDDEKSKLLLTIRNDLIHHGYFVKDRYFLDLIKNKQIDVYGYSNKDAVLNEIFNEENVSCNYTTFENDLVSPLFTFKNHEEEIHNLFIKICDLIKDGVDVNDIFIFSCCDDYETMIIRYAKLYNIKVNGVSPISLKLYDFGKEFFNSYLNNKDFSLTIDELDDKYQKDLNYNVFKQNLVSLKNDELTFEQQYDVFNNGVTATDMMDTYDNAVTLIDHPIFVQGKHIFVVGFNQKSYPMVKADNQFLPNDIKSKHHLLTTKQENLIQKEELISFLNTNNNFIYSFANNIYKTKAYISFIKDDIKVNVLDASISDHDYCLRAAGYELLKLKDLLYKYKEKHSELYSYKEKIDFPYKDYDNQFKTFNIINDDTKIVYSYSKINDYVSCPFSYYMKHILKIDPYDDNFSSRLGSAFHSVLEDGLKNLTASFEDLYAKYFDTDEFSTKEKLLCFNLKQDVEIALTNVRNQLADIKDVRVELEKEIFIQLNDKSYLKGYIDKILIVDNKFVAIIDYKTTNKQNFAPSKLQYGKSLQLPTYALLMSESSEFSKYTIGGLYINCILHTSKDDMNEPTPKYLKLKGLTLTSCEYLAAMEPNFTNKEVRYIDYKPKDDLNDFSSKGTFSSEDCKKYIDLSKNIYQKCDENIRANNFKISPLVLGSSSSCTNCKLKDICFVKSEQERFFRLTKGNKNDEVE